jgi:hypothetical protein
MTGKRDVYVAIMHAAANGRGLHLTADEVWGLSFDDAIATRAGNMLTEDEHRGVSGEDFWRKKKPYLKGRPANLFGYATDDPERINDGSNHGSALPK